MARDVKNNDDKFIEYTNFIFENPVYEGLAKKRRSGGGFYFVTTKKSEIGKARIKWAKEKIKVVKVDDEKNDYAALMRELHPTKYTVCQICGSRLSIYYYYPSKTAIKGIKKEFGLDVSYIDHIEDIWDRLIEAGFTHEKIGKYFLEKVSLPDNPKELTKDEIIDKLEYQCRINGKRLLGPGAMSDFPDRFDGFHSYNRCCREKEDRGRWEENMHSYSKDRRAYEKWSDGNTRAADQFMHSDFFKGKSADHIGPLALGFVHDPRFMQPLSVSENSSKRDKLLKEDIEKMIKIEDEEKICAANWYAKIIWEYVKGNYKREEEKIESNYREALKQNMSNFMYLFYKIINEAGCIGEDFLSKYFLENKYKEYYGYNYKFDYEKRKLEKFERNETESKKYEFENIKRISFDSIVEYSQRNNKNMQAQISGQIEKEIENAIEMIKNEEKQDKIYSKILNIMNSLQDETIKKIILCGEEK